MTSPRHSLAARLRERWGARAVLDIALEPEDAAGPPADLSSEVLRQLAARPDGSGCYRIRGEVAHGGMGAILRVWDEDLRRHLAMKVILGSAPPAEGAAEGAGAGPATPPIDARLVSRFLEEAQVTGQLEHPGIVPVHELGLDSQGRVFFTMKLVKGEDLKAVFARLAAGEEGWSVTRALGLLLKVCEAMAYAHAKGVIHRDLKPANVMVGKYGEVYVMDWGLARVLGREDSKDLRIREPTPPLSTEVATERRRHAAEHPDSPLVTMDGDIVGTPSYMSPEQASGQLERMGPPSDVYALGAMLYHLLSGRMPYVVPGALVNNYAILSRVQEGPPRPLHELAPDTPAELVAICEKAMARRPEDRYADMSALADDLRAYLEHRVVAAYETGAVAELRKWVVRNKPLAAALAAGVLLLAGGLTSSLVLKARADASAQLAEERRVLAEAERSNVLRLSAFQQLEDLRREADALWPATPDRVPEYDTWLTKAKALVAGLEPSPDGNDSGHLAQLANLRARALPRTEAERAADRTTHPRFPELQRMQAKLAWMERVQAIRAGEAEPDAFELPAAGLPGDASSLNALAWPLVDPERTTFGREAEGLALARRALETARAEERARIGDTLAWALLANGQDEQALAASEAARDAATAQERPELEARFAKLREAVAAARAPGWLAETQAALASLDAEVDERSFPFADPQDTWWHNQLTTLVAEIEAFADPGTGLIEGMSPDHGWGIARRRQFAATVEERTVTGSEAARRWAEASASIADRGQCPLYDGLKLSPQLGLLPIGRDPDSGLWEFWHVMSGEEPVRGADGRLVLAEEMGIVLVLLPGGTFWMGAQKDDPEGRNYDPDAHPNESPVHEVTVSPFFLSKYEMTQGQWQRFTAATPSTYGADHYYVDWNSAWQPWSALHPVTDVDWHQSMAAMARLGLALPTEAQWEYGCRAGTSSVYWSGDAREALAGVANVADRYAKTHDGKGLRSWEDWLDDGSTVHAEVGSYRANAFGLHDVHGNVREWCRDGYDFFGASSHVDPFLDPAGAAGRCVRGGGFDAAAVNVRAAIRLSILPTSRGNNGLRPAKGIT